MTSWLKIGSMQIKKHTHSFYNFPFIRIRDSGFLLTTHKVILYHFVFGYLTLHKKCPYSELFLRKNTDQNNSEYGRFLRSVKSQQVPTNVYLFKINKLNAKKGVKYVQS